MSFSIKSLFGKIPRKAIYVGLGFLVEGVRQAFPDAPIPDTTTIMAAVGLLVGGHVVTDVASMFKK